MSKKKVNPSKETGDDFLFSMTDRTPVQEMSEEVHIFLHDMGKQADWDDEMDANCRVLSPVEQAFYDRQKAMGLTFNLEPSENEQEFMALQEEYFANVIGDRLKV